MVELIYFLMHPNSELFSHSLSLLTFLLSYFFYVFWVHNKLEVFSLFHTTYISQMSLSYVSYPETFLCLNLQYAPIQYVFIWLKYSFQLCSDGCEIWFSEPVFSFCRGQSLKIRIYSAKCQSWILTRKIVGSKNCLKGIFSYQISLLAFQ